MKKIAIVFLVLICCLSMCLFCACSGNTSPSTEQPANPPIDQPASNELKDFSGITFASVEHTYDGQEKVLLINGSLPTGAQVTYSNNSAIDAGEYNATALVKCEGFNDLTLSATLTINKAKIIDVAFENKSFDYDGQKKSIEISGKLPIGTDVAYSLNNGIDAGTYNATATITGKNYETLVLNAVLTINKVNILGISIQENQSSTYDEQYHLPEILGVMPADVSIKYYVNDSLVNSGVNSVGTYDFRIEISGKNYNTLLLNCIYKIKLNFTSLVDSLFQSFKDVPDVWSFLPQSFKPENRTINSLIDYSNFVNISSIHTNGIGKQLSVAYGLLNKTTKAISYVQPIYASLNTIKNLYTTFIDDNPEDYKSFSGSVSGFNFTLNLTDTEYSISASVGSIGVVIYSNTNTKTYGARVQLTDTTVLKYTVSENNLILAMDVLDTVATQIEFIREGNNILGYMYEYIILGDKQLRAASTLISVGETYTTLIGTKGDFIPTADSRNCEVYLNTTGELVGTEVRELLNIKALGDALYNTLWYTLNDVSGITSIRKDDTANGLNLDTIYINGATEAIHSKVVNILPTSKKAYSRRFDIEFKKMYFYQYNAQSEEYEEVSCEIPMMFVQEEMLGEFINDFSDVNEDYLSGKISLSVSEADKTAVSYGYYTLLQAYDLIKDSVTFEAITSYCKQ